jgi:magnesium transporter
MSSMDEFIEEADKYRKTCQGHPAPEGGLFDPLSDGFSAADQNVPFEGAKSLVRILAMSKDGVANWTMDALASFLEEQTSSPPTDGQPATALRRPSGLPPNPNNPSPHVSDPHKNRAWEQSSKLSKKKDVPRYWIDVAFASPDDLETLAPVLGLHPVTIEDVQVRVRQKVEWFQRYSFFVFSEMHYREGSTALESVQIKSLVFPEVVVTFHAQEAHCISRAMYRLAVDCDWRLPCPGWALYAIMDEICDIFVEFVDRVAEETIALDDLVLVLSRSEQGELLGRIADARRKASSLQTTMWQKREVLEEMLKVDTDLSQYFLDVYDHVVSMTGRLLVTQDTLNRLDNTYLTRVNLQVAEASEDMNKVMKRLSAIATIFMPLGVLVGLWGTNVNVPGQYKEGDSDYAAFTLITIALIITCGLQLWLFTRFGWL